MHDAGSDRICLFKRRYCLRAADKNYLEFTLTQFIYLFNPLLKIPGIIRFVWAAC